MKRSVLLALAAVAASVPSTASAEPVRYGGICKALTQSSPDRSTTSGYVHGGPFAVTENGLPATARVVCSIQVGDYAHSAPDAVTVPGAVSTGVVVLPPTAFVGEGDFVSDRVMCTRVEVVDGPTYYFDGVAEAWTTDPGAPCAATFGGGGVAPPPYVAAVLCPVLATASTDVGPVVVESEGDVVVGGVQELNCPSYDD